MALVHPRRSEQVCVHTVKMGRWDITTAPYRTRYAPLRAQREMIQEGSASDVKYHRC